MESIKKTKQKMTQVNEQGHYKKTNQKKKTRIIKNAHKIM